jgi:hypothetical protein
MKLPVLEDNISGPSGGINLKNQFRNGENPLQKIHFRNPFQTLDFL